MVKSTGFQDHAATIQAQDDFGEIQSENMQLQQ